MWYIKSNSILTIKTLKTMIKNKLIKLKMNGRKLSQLFFNSHVFIFQQSGKSEIKVQGKMK